MQTNENAESNEYVVSNCVYCNLRKGPSINYKIRTAICAGTIVKVIDWSHGDWVLIEVDDITGYIPARYLSNV